MTYKPVFQGQVLSSDNSTTLSGVTSSRAVSCSTTLGSKVVTSAALFTSADVGSLISGTGIPDNAVIVGFTDTSTITFQAAPDYFNANPDPAATATGSPSLTITDGYCGTYELTRANNYVRQLLTVASTEASGLGGTLVFQYSADGVTAGISEVRKITDFNTVRDIDLINAGSYYRMMFAPSRVLVSGESVFLTTEHQLAFNGPFVRLGNQEVEEDNAAYPGTFAYMKGFRSNGKSIGLNLTRSGAVTMASEAIEIVRGNVIGRTTLDKYGKNLDVDTTTVPEDVWLGGSVYPGFPTGSPETVEIFSSSANDTAAGTGVRTVRITGLMTSSSTEYESEDLTMNGTTAVTSANTWYRVNRVTALTAGSGETNAGTLTVRHTTTTANIFAQIAAGSGRTAVCCSTVPDGTTLMIEMLYITMARASGSAGSANVALQQRAFGSSVWVNRRDYEITNSFPASPPLKSPIDMSAQMDFRVRVLDVSDNNSVFSAEIQGTRVDD